MARSGHQVERDLGIEDRLWQFLKREQVHGLLVQFVHTLLPVFRGRLEYVCNRVTDGSGLLRAQDEQGERDRCGCATTHGPGWSSNAGVWPSWRSIQGRANGRRGVIFKRVRKIDDGAARVPRNFPILAGKVWSEAKKVKSRCSNCSLRTLWMKVISSPMVSSCPRDSSSSSSLRRRLESCGR